MTAYAGGERVTVGHVGLRAALGQPPFGGRHPPARALEPQLRERIAARLSRGS